MSIEKIKDNVKFDLEMLVQKMLESPSKADEYLESFFTYIKVNESKFEYLYEELYKHGCMPSETVKEVSSYNLVFVLCDGLKMTIKNDNEIRYLAIVLFDERVTSIAQKSVDNSGIVLSMNKFDSKVYLPQFEYLNAERLKEVLKSGYENAIHMIADEKIKLFEENKTINGGG